VATAVTIGTVALPERKRLGYGPGLTGGAVAAGGTLGFLIPPSTGFVIYAVLTEDSIGRLFMAGVLPGLLPMALFIGTVWISSVLAPEAGPRGPRADTVRTPAMLHMVVIGANVLNPFLAVTHIPATLGEGPAGLGLDPCGALAVIVLAYVILGMSLDGLSMLVVTIPIVFASMTQNGFDPIWFGVIAVILVEMGMITPPAA